MCRIMVVDPIFLRYINLEPLLDFLEDSLGGDGNGIGYISNKKKILVKGLPNKYPVAGLNKHLLKNIDSINSPILFHTRKATSGGITDDNAQPFICKSGFLLHNGSVLDISSVKNALLCTRLIDAPTIIQSSDTRILSLLSDNYSPSVLTSIYNPGVLVHMDNDGNVEVNVSHGSFEGLEIKNIGWIWASSFPHEIDSFLDNKIIKRVEIGANSSVMINKEGYTVKRGKVSEKTKDQGRWDPFFREEGGSWTDAQNQGSGPDEFDLMRSLVTFHCSIADVNCVSMQEGKCAPDCIFYKTKYFDERPGGTFILEVQASDENDIITQGICANCLSPQIEDYPEKCHQCGSLFNGSVLISASIADEN